MSPLETKSKIIQFVEDHKDDHSENSHKQVFWNEFFAIFGIRSSKVGVFEERAKTIKGNTGFIDYFWPGTLIIEHKSKGEKLDGAYTQALDYLTSGGVKDSEIPKYVIVSDFEWIRINEIGNSDNQVQFKTVDLLQNFHHFNFILGYDQRAYKDEDPVNIEASELMGDLHDELESVGFEGHPLRLMLVRLMFCFFADDTGIFPKDEFLFYFKEKTKEDGSDLGAILNNFFLLLNTSLDKRQKNLDPALAQFPYVNGELFAEIPSMVSFSKSLRDKLIQCCEFDWSKVSPAIFGSLFQSVMDKKERRALGAHYTSEKNILKTIHGLFLDDLYEEFEELKAKKNYKGLEAFLVKLRKIKILDPACGCGNFLILSYRELRLLEIRVLEIIHNKKENKGLRELSIQWMDGLDVDMLYGIELEEFPALIAKTAIWIMDHLMNRVASNAFGEYYVRLPLKKAPHITIGNALRMKWEDVVKPEELTYILGNPPFIGYSYQTEEQKKDMDMVFGNIKGTGVLDYVTSWYKKSAEYIQKTNIEVAFVSTNSICQGEQVTVLWKLLQLNYGIKINLAHRTFKWTNEARGKAAVHVIIIGFSLKDKKEKQILDYSSNEQKRILTKQINPYLVSANSIFIDKVDKPICDVPEMIKGSSPTDGGFLILEDEDITSFLSQNKGSEKFIRLYIGSEEFINRKKRWCLWLKESNPKDLRNFDGIVDRIKKVKEFRLKSTKEATRKKSEYPFLFAEERQPNTDYILIPRVSSEQRLYIPIGFMPKEVIVSDSAIALPKGKIYHLGVLSSLMHNAWMRVVAGRLKSDYRYSNTIVYNNFPWPEDLTGKQIEEIESLAQKVLDARAIYPDSSLADLYDPLTMPKELRDAHNKLDKAVDKAYRSKPFETEAERVEFLFGLYEKYTSGLISATPAKKKPARKKAK